MEEKKLSAFSFQLSSFSYWLLAPGACGRKVVSVVRRPFSASAINCQLSGVSRQVMIAIGFAAFVQHLVRVKVKAER
jgi:hypothetical protein